VIVVRAALVLAAFLPALAQAPPVEVRISVDLSGPTTRLMVTAPRPVPWRVAAAPGGLEVVFGEPVRLDPPSQTLEDPILRGWRVAGDRLQLQTGPGFTGQETFELRNPWRLVLDLQGRRPDGPAGTAPVAPTTVIVLDPGHGGVETGAVGPTGLQEKEVTLDLARRLRALLQRTDPGLAVVLTRDEDRQVARDERTAIANQNRAELFLSLHLNSSPSKAATGAETYFLSAEATDDDARTLAGLENEAARRGVPAAEPAAASGSLDLILWDLAQNQYLAESARLAEGVQRELNAVAGTRDRGVRQAPFTVLMGATMPAILVELGFLSNPAEEKRLKDAAYRDRLVEALARAVAGFRQSVAALR
jgi:N-acetylmuramoyl-L-alanine amidase